MLSNTLISLSSLIVAWNNNWITNKLDLIEKDLQKLPDDIVSSIWNFSYFSEDSQKEQLKSETKKYADRLMQWDKFAAYEFMSKVMKNDLYNLWAVVNNFDIDWLKWKQLKDILSNESDESKINSGIIWKQFTIFWAKINIPQSDYAKLIIKARKESLDSYNKIDDSYVLQKLINEILTLSETEVKNVLKWKEWEKYVDLMYNNKWIISEFSKHWTNYAIKWVMLWAAMYWTWWLAWNISWWIIWKTWLTWISSSVVELWVNTALITPVTTIGSWIINWQSFSDSASNLKNWKLWLESAAMIWVFTWVSKILWAVWKTGTMEKLWWSIKEISWWKFLLSWVNFWVEVWSMVWVNNIVFDWEFTAEEIVNSIMYVAFMKWADVKISKTPKWEIKLIEYKPMQQIEYKPMKQIEYKPMQQIEYKPENPPPVSEVNPWKWPENPPPVPEIKSWVLEIFRNKNKIDFEWKNWTSGELNILPKDALISEINIANNRINNLALWEKAILWTKTEWNYLEIINIGDWFVVREFQNNIKVSISNYSWNFEIKMPNDWNFIVPELIINWKHYWNIKQVEIVEAKKNIDFERKKWVEWNLKLLHPTTLEKMIKNANESIVSLEQWEKIYLWTKIEWNHLEITKTTDWYNLQVYENWNISWQQISTSDAPSIKISTKEWFIVPELNYWNWLHYWNIKEVLFSIK